MFLVEDKSIRVRRSLHDIVGCDFHPGWQQVAVFDSATGEIREQKLENGNGEAERFYRSLPSPARVGFEACGNTQWFEDLLDGLGHEVWIGMRPRFVPAMCASRRRIVVTRPTY